MRPDKESVNRRLSPWMEVVGTVEEVGNESITLVVTHTVHVAKDELAKWIHKLRKGCRVGVLALDDGSMRVRCIDGEVAEQG